ncbi:CotH kinase family protein [Desulforegula conservatrix]|uniref:CotH kinase family protein n=1 Tax=Desulforegula conservatrix TaxID=153026 RepID=UPI00042674D5|nr:CotH kinase family protein [Desulforegula conservatrix]
MGFKGKIIPVLFLALLAVWFVSGCNSSSTSSSDTDTKDASSDEDEVVRPEGWTAKTHGNKADPDYSVVFPDNAVGRIDITISATDWQAMMTDENLVSAFGEFGSKAGTGTGNGTGTSPGGAGVPPALPDGSNPQTPGTSPGGTTPPAMPEGMTPPSDGTTPGGTTASSGTGLPDAGAALEMSENPEWKPCTFMCNGLTWNYVGVRFKGNSSLSSTWSKGIYKLPLRFEFDQFEDEYPAIKNQRFYGFKTLSMSSGYNDDSLIREKVAADIFRNLGVPSPKAAFYRVYVDCGDGSGSKYFGLYTMVEVPDKPMLNAYFGNSEGNLYKPSGSTATFGSGALSEDDFDKENNKDDADYSDVNALYTAVNDSSSDASTWKSNLEKVFDVDGFLKWLAVNTVIQNWDTYGVMAHNYYLYNNGGRLAWIPWDNNESLKGSDSGLAGVNAMAGGMGSRTLSLELDESSLASWPLISRIIAQPEYRSLYDSYVDKTVTDYFNTSIMQPIFLKAHDLISDYVIGDEGEKAGYTLLSNEAAFLGSVDSLNSHVVSRTEAVGAYLGR